MLTKGSSIFNRTPMRISFCIAGGIAGLICGYLIIAKWGASDEEMPIVLQCLTLPGHLLGAYLLCAILPPSAGTNSLTMTVGTLAYMIGLAIQLAVFGWICAAALEWARMRTPAKTRGSVG